MLQVVKGGAEIILATLLPFCNLFIAEIQYLTDMWQGIVVILIIVIVGIGFISILMSGNLNLMPSNQVAESERGVTIEDITTDPVVYRGLVVEVGGSITDWNTKRAFVLSSRSGLGLSNDVLVIRREEFDLPRRTPQGQLALGEEADVIVRGRVRVFDTVAVERELGVNLIDDEYSAWNNRAVVLSESIQKQ